jgi:tetratricopeptide (TPR) repeat protein
LHGNLDNAESLGLEAEALCPDSAREALLVQAVVLRVRGRWDEAVERMGRALRLGVLENAFFERRSQASMKLWKAVFEAEVGRLDEAWADLREAVAELGHDPKLGLICEAAWVRLLSHQGEHNESVRRADALRSRLDDQAPSPSTESDCLDLLGRGLFEVGEYERAQRCWERYLAVPHPPIAEPIGQYYFGECRWHLGDRAGARHAFQRATAPGIDSHHARLAEQRARELSMAVGNGVL